MPNGHFSMRHATRSRSWFSSSEAWAALRSQRPMRATPSSCGNESLARLTRSRQLSRDTFTTQEGDLRKASTRVVELCGPGVTAKGAARAQAHREHSYDARCSRNSHRKHDGSNASLSHAARAWSSNRSLTASPKAGGKTGLASTLSALTWSVPSTRFGRLEGAAVAPIRLSPQPRCLAVEPITGHQLPQTLPELCQPESVTSRIRVGLPDPRPRGSPRCGGSRPR
jgi:hypothetical protein